MFEHLMTSQKAPHGDTILSTVIYKFWDHINEEVGTMTSEIDEEEFKEGLRWS